MSRSWILEPGVVLFVERYADCLAFYRDHLGMPVQADYGDVVILRFGSGYLMLEPQSGIAQARKDRSQNPAVLRFNVADVDAEAARLAAAGIDIEVSHHDWGSVGRFRDPDGNPCELRNHYDGTFAPRPQPSPTSGRL